MKEVSCGFLKKDAKAYRPDKETGKWRGGKTKNGSFDTIKPGWSSEINIDGSIPKDNPKFKGNNIWLPDIFLIGSYRVHVIFVLDQHFLMPVSG